MSQVTKEQLEAAARAAAHGVEQAAETAAPKIEAAGRWSKLWIAGHPQFAMGFAVGCVVGGLLVYLFTR